MGGVHAPAAERFWRAVDIDAAAATDHCWTWRLSRDRKGYGQFGLTPHSRRMAHRFAWELTYGPIRDGLLVLHHCDNPPCVRPSHLFLGTKADNYNDMRAKGRARKPPRLGLRELVRAIQLHTGHPGQCSIYCADDIYQLLNSPRLLEPTDAEEAAEEAIA